MYELKGNSEIVKYKKLNRDIIQSVLLEIGIFPNLKGFEHITDTILLIDSGKTKITDIYSIIAKENGLVSTAIERSIKTAFNRCDKDSKEYEKYIGKAKYQSEKLFTLHYNIQKEYCKCIKDKE